MPPGLEDAPAVARSDESFHFQTVAEARFRVGDAGPGHRAGVVSGLTSALASEEISTVGARVSTPPAMRWRRTIKHARPPLHSLAGRGGHLGLSRDPGLGPRPVSSEAAAAAVRLEQHCSNAASRWGTPDLRAPVRAAPKSGVDAVPVKGGSLG
jgi:hypothetical protein